MLFEDEYIKARKAVLAELNARCGCGQTSNPPYCKSKRCNCRKFGKKCDQRYGCPRTTCKNSRRTRQGEKGQDNVDRNTENVTNVDETHTEVETTDRMRVDNIINPHEPGDKNNYEKHQLDPDTIDEGILYDLGRNRQATKNAVYLPTRAHQYLTLTNLLGLEIR